MTKKIDIEELKAKISYEELYNLYITQNKSYYKVCNILNLTESQFELLRKEYNLSKKILQSKNISKEDLYELYIIQNLSSIQIAKIYNCAGITIRRNIHKFNLKKDKNKRRENRNKVYKENFILNHNVEHPMQLKEVKDKIEKTNIKKYGYKNTFQVPEFKKKSKEHYKQKTGYDNPNQNPIVREKIRNTLIQKRSLTKSKDEIYIETLLKTKFYNIEIQKFDILRYPFKCDFYIPSLNLYIEYQGTWKHGKEPFNINNIKHQNIIYQWEQKVKVGHRAYKDAIYTWTNLDIRKRETAKKNGLNWIEFFSLDEFLSWFRAQSGTPLLVYSPL